MRLASLRAGGRDGTLVVVGPDLERAMPVPEVAATLQRALDEWERAAPRLAEACERLEADPSLGRPLAADDLAAPLPRAYQWLDASAYLSHIERARRARGAEMPPDARRNPLMYQGVSDGFLAPTDPIVAADPDWGIDFEGEVAVVTDDVAAGTPAEAAAAHVKLVLLVNDVSLRNLIPAEVAKGFGFIHGKPASALSPLAVTPDELGEAWDGARMRRPLACRVNGELVGAPDAGEDMQFGFPELVAHAARTRRLGAGTIIGSGTVSNADPGRGCACLLERRLLETIEAGEPRTPYLRHGDRVRIEMLDADGGSIFGAIDQEVRTKR